MDVLRRSFDEPDEHLDLGGANEAARVMAKASPDRILVTDTIRLLPLSSGFKFEDAGEHELKGVPDRWHLYPVVPA